MKRRTEVGAVEWIDAGLLGFPKQGLRLTGHNEQFSRIRAHYAKAMRHIPILFQIGYVEIDFIAHLDSFQIVGVEMASDGAHIYPDHIAAPFHPYLVGFL